MDQRLRVPQWVCNRPVVLVSVDFLTFRVEFSRQYFGFLDSHRFCVKGVTGQNVWPINTLFDLIRLFVERKFLTDTLSVTTETKRVMLSRTEAISHQFCVQQKEPR